MSRLMSCTPRGQFIFLYLIINKSTFGLRLEHRWGRSGIYLKSHHYTIVPTEFITILSFLIIKTILLTQINRRFRTLAKLKATKF